ncbi:MAG: hypothetical protein AAF761_08320, partial [Pseudomonadota bacterium]
ASDTSETGKPSEPWAKNKPADDPVPEADDETKAGSDEDTAQDVGPGAADATKPEPEFDPDEEFPDPIVEDITPAPVQAEEPERTSLAARALQFIFLIVVGIALALWGAPRLAPMLPAGLSPVAEFLMPGQRQVADDIAALRSELDTRLAGLSTGPDPAETQSAISDAIEAYDERLAEELALIKDQLAGFDAGAIEARIAALETRLEGASAELREVSDRLSRQITENGVALSEEASSRLSGYQAALEGLRAEVADLSAKNGALGQRVEEIAAIAARRVEEAQTEAENRVASTATKRLLTEIDAALESGAPFAAALSALADASDFEAPATLAQVAETGTPSLTTLRNQFSDQAYAALRADAAASASDGMGGRLGAFLRSQVGSRSLERKEGDGADAILSRVGDDLANGRLDAAVAEANALSEAAKTAMGPWINNVTALATARAEFAELSAQLGANP